MYAQHPSRWRAAVLFGGVGLIAGAAHVLVSDMDNVRLWREVLPLAGFVGGGLGGLFRPIGWRRGALAGLQALLAFATAYAIAETAIQASQNEIAGVAGWISSVAIWVVVVLSKAAVGGIVAIIASGALGLWLERRSECI